MKKLLYCVLCITGLLFCSISCMEEQDFDQIDDLNITPTLASGIFYLESDEQTINSAGALGSFYFQEVTFKAFNEQYVAERLIEGTITYEMENTTSKTLRIIVEFLNEGGGVLDVERFDIEANSPSVVERSVFYGVGGKNIDILSNTSSLRVTADNLGDGSSVSSDGDPKVIFRSGAEFLFQLK
ncbi:MAG: hypothetical protein NXH90_06765 [Flavobacteriaceae bacterium]|nr:hypothetical protein [Flavobacteriaceae bacterium]